MLAFSCCSKDDLLRTGHISCLVTTFHRCFGYDIPPCDVLVLVVFLCFFFGLVVLLFACGVVGCCVFLSSPWNHIISVHYEPGSLSQHWLLLQ